MVYYSKIYQIWMLDLWDYFIISVLIGQFIASRLKRYLSEKESIKRLKESLKKESQLLAAWKRTILSQKSKSLRIYRFALDNRGGDFLFLDDLMNLDTDPKRPFRIAQGIKSIVTRLLIYLKENELKRILKVIASK